MDHDPGDLALCLVFWMDFAHAPQKETNPPDTIRAPVPTLRRREGVPNLSATHAAEVDTNLSRC